MDAVVHFEIPAEDLDRAKDFYAAAFGWTSYTVPMGDSDYVTVTTVPVDRATMMPTEPGAINGGLVQKSAAMSAPVVTIGVASIDAALGEAKKALEEHLEQTAQLALTLESGPYPGTVRRPAALGVLHYY